MMSDRKAVGFLGKFGTFSSLASPVRVRVRQVIIASLIVRITWKCHDEHYPRLVRPAGVARSPDHLQSHPPEDVVRVLERVLLDTEPRGCEGVHGVGGGEISYFKVLPLLLQADQPALHLVGGLHDVVGHGLQLP